MQQTLVLCPLYNDIESFNTFALHVNIIAESLPGTRFSILVVNDGTIKTNINSPLPTCMIHLYRNMGHQKAIAIGLSYAIENLTFDQVVIMDCDGEDKPEDIPALLNKFSQTGQIIVAKRGKRNETAFFKFFYKAYKFFFQLLTGKRINFGNFMLLSRQQAASIVRYSEIWNNIAGTVVKSGMAFTALKLNRGRRYSGISKMNFNALMLHGLSAIGVFLEIIATRLFIFSLIMILLSIVAIGIILYIKLFTQKAIPGWATSAVSAMLIVILESFLLSLFTIFIFHSSQSQRKLIPAVDYTDFIKEIETNDNG